MSGNKLIRLSIQVNTVWGERNCPSLAVFTVNCDLLVCIMRRAGMMHATSIM